MRSIRMAYGNNAGSKGFGNTARTAAPVAAATATKKVSDQINIAGLYEHEKADGTPSKLVMKGSVKEAITIPAGYQLRLFVKGGKSKNGKDLPPFELVAQPPRARTQG